MLRFIKFLYRCIYLLLVGHKWKPKEKVPSKKNCNQCACSSFRNTHCDGGNCSYHCRLYCKCIENKQQVVRTMNDPAFIISNAERWVIAEVFENLANVSGAGKLYTSDSQKNCLISKILDRCSYNGISKDRTIWLLDVLNLHNKENCASYACYTCASIYEYKSKNHANN